MKPIGPLMWEHRLIERLIKALEGQIHKIRAELTINGIFIDTAVDFIRTYADRTHHGKEEDILFRELRKKPLTNEDRLLMDELIEDHFFSRNTTNALVEANMRYRRGNETALSELMACLKTLVEFYPTHIKKEDDVFFPASRNYFSDQEDQVMLAEFWEFDRKMIHEKYKAVVKSLG